MAGVEHFKSDVRRYDTIDSDIQKITEQLKPLQVKLKDLRSTKKELEGTICGFMQTNEIAECKLTEGALVYKESKTVVPLLKQNIKDNVLKFFKEEAGKDEFKKGSAESKADLLFTFVYDTREYSEKTTLKRI